MIGDEDFLALVRTGMSPYEAYARANMGWTEGDLKKENPTFYGLVKAIVIGLGYGMGWDRFHMEIESGKYDSPAVQLSGQYTLDDITTIVREYRETNWKVKQFWGRSLRDITNLAGHREVQVPLISGRPLRYYYPPGLPDDGPMGQDDRLPPRLLS